MQLPGTKHSVTNWAVALGLLLGLLGSPQVLPAAAPQVRLQWQADSVRLGALTALQVRVPVPQSATVLWPSGGKAFGSWEVAETGQATYTNGAWQQTYQLRSFSIAAEQGLRLHLPVVQAGDTLQLTSDSVALPFARRVPQLDSTQLMARQTRFRLVPVPVVLPIDWTFWGILFGLLLAIGGLLTLLLRPVVLRWLARRRIQQQWRQLQQALTLAANATGEPTDQLRTLNQHWKSWLATDAPFAGHPAALTPTELEHWLAEHWQTVPAEARTAATALLAAEHRLRFAGEQTQAPGRERLHQWLQQLWPLLEAHLALRLHRLNPRHQ